MNNQSYLNDPDFDPPITSAPNEQTGTAFFNQLSPTVAFKVGLIGGVMILCTIGFFVLLIIVLRGGVQVNAATSRSGTSGSPTPVVVSPPPLAPPTPTEIKLAPVTDKDWVRGKKNAKIAVVEFSDTECPFCKRFHPTMQQLIKEYPDKVKWIYRHFPLTSIHPKAPKEAEATECAGELGGNEGFWKYIDRLFEVTPANNGLDLAQLPQIAEDVGLNRKKFESCLESGKYAEKVQKQADDAVAAGARGTPYSVVVVGDQKIPVSGAVPFEQLKTIIDGLIKE